MFHCSLQTQHGQGAKCGIGAGGIQHAGRGDGAVTRSNRQVRSSWVRLRGSNWSRADSTSALQVAARLATWFVGGAAMTLGMRLTAMALAWPRLARWPAWWVGGLGFIGIELVVHLAMQLRGRASFYNGRG
jgi:hypothetical protein